MAIDNTTTEVIVSTITVMVQEPIISTMTETIKDNVAQIPFDIISQIRDFYEICWNKLIWYITGIGGIGVCVLGYVGYFFPKDFKERLSKQEKAFDLYKKEQNIEFVKQKEEQKAEFARQVDKQKKDFENKIKNIEENFSISMAAIFENTAILLSRIYETNNKEKDKYFIENYCIVLCSAINSLLEIENSIYEKDNVESLNKKLNNLKYILKEENKNFINKNLLKEVLNGLNNIDRKKINADVEDNIKKISDFYNTL